VCGFVVEHSIESRTFAVVSLHGSLTSEACDVVLNRLSFVAALLDNGAHCRLEINTATGVDRIDDHGLTKSCSDEAKRHGIHLGITWH
jgi:hypothetical protein